MENGRRYRGHKDEFLRPSDDEALRSYSSLNTAYTHLLEAEGQDLISALVVLHKGTEVLDFGARGTTWMYNVEEKYPGTPIAVINPGCAWLWPAFVTVHHGVEDNWPFTAWQAFHYIRGFALGGMIADYEGLYRHAYKHLLPGGWFEVRDHDLQFFVDAQSGDKEEEDTGGEEKEKLVKLRRWEKLMAEATEKFGKPINMEQSMRTSWSGQDLQMCMKRYPSLEGHTLRLFTMTLGWPLRDSKAFNEQLRAKISAPKLDHLRLYSLFRVVYGKKPKTASREPEDSAFKSEVASSEPDIAAQNI